MLTLICRLDSFEVKYPNFLRYLGERISFFCVFMFYNYFINLLIMRSNTHVTNTPRFFILDRGIQTLDPNTKRR